MNYAIRPATPTSIICRKDNQGNLVVYLLDTLHTDGGGSIEKWTVGDDKTTTRVALADYHVSKGVSDMDEQIIADAFVEAWGARNGITIRRRLYKQSPHHLAAQGRSANSTLVPTPAAGQINGTPLETESVPPLTTSAKNEAIDKFAKALESAQALFTQADMDKIIAQKVYEMKQELTDKVITAVTKALLEALWK